MNGLISGIIFGVLGVLFLWFNKPISRFRIGDMRFGDTKNVKQFGVFWLIVAAIFFAIYLGLIDDA